MPQPKFKDRPSEERWQINAMSVRLGLIRGGDRSAYYDMLWTVGRVRSSKDLDSAGRKRVLDHLRALDGQPRRKAKDPKAAKILSLWIQLRDAGLIQNASDGALRSEIQNLTGCSDVKFCTEAQKSHVIECLKGWLKRAD